MALLDQALQYAARGWHVFPLQPGTKKGHLLSNGHLGASKDPDQIRSWFEEHPDRNIGIAIKPSGLLVLDVDTNGDKQGAESLALIDSELPNTLMARTGRGGMHAVYDAREGFPQKRVIEFLPGLDLLGDGYIVASPSKVATGSYAWLGGSVAPAPVALCKILEKRSAPAPNPDAPAGSITEGSRNTALFRLGCALRDQGIGEDALLAALESENTRRCNPPLDHNELSMICASVMMRVDPEHDAVAGSVFLEAIGIEQKQEQPDVADAQLAYEIAKQDQPPIRVYESGFPELDKLVGGGIQTRGVHVIVGPPGTGKTGHALGIARHISKTHQVPSLYLSSELERTECSGRLAAIALGCPHKDVLRGKVSKADRSNAIRDDQVYLLGVEDYIKGTKGLEKLKPQIDKITARHGVPPIVFIDYLQNLTMALEDGKEIRTGVSSLIYSVRVLSLLCDCALVVVSSTARSSYKKLEEDNPVTYLSAAKESGDIEYAATNVVYLDVDPDHVNGEYSARIAVAKARSGETGFVGAKFHGPSGKWSPCAESISLMSAASKSAKVDQGKVDADNARVLDVVQKHGPKTWTRLRALCGGNAQNVNAARDRLVCSGAIQSAEHAVLEADHRMRTRVVFFTPGNGPKAPAAPVIDKNSTAAEFLKG